LNNSLPLLVPELHSCKAMCDAVALARNARNIPDVKELKINQASAEGVKKF